MTSRRLAAALGAGILALPLLPLMAAPAAAVSAPVPVATGLNGPYKPTVGPDGAIYVAESGVGGDGPCVTVQDPEAGGEVENCYGTTGSVTKIATDGTVTKAVTDLPSVGGPEGASGPVDVAFAPDGTMYVVTGFGGDKVTRDKYGDDRVGAVLQIQEDGTADLFADLVAYEAANDPDQGQPGAEGIDTNPFGITFDGEDILAVDAGGNDVLRITPDGTISTEAVLPFNMTPAPPFLGAPPGTMIPYQPVPTSIELDAEGTPLVGQLTGFPFPVGAANVYDVSGDTPTVVESGLTNVIDIAPAPDGTLYVVEFADNGLLSEAPAPALVQIRPDGTRKYLLYGDEMPPPGGVTVGADGMVYVSVCNVCGPGAGMVWKIDPSVPSDPATSDACVPDDVPGTAFADIKSSVHREAIACMAWWGAIEGFADGSFRPQSPITRGQAASMVARALATAGVELPQDRPDAFSDDAGVHESDVNALAEMGIVEGFPDGTYRPSLLITRGQIASLFARAWEVATGDPLADGPDAFTDDEASVHEAAINATAAAGWVNGVGGGKFDPGAPATRGQFASVLARMLSNLVADGFTTPPTA